MREDGRGKDRVPLVRIVGESSLRIGDGYVLCITLSYGDNEKAHRKLKMYMITQLHDY